MQNIEQKEDLNKITEKLDKILELLTKGAKKCNTIYTKEKYFANE